MFFSGEVGCTVTESAYTVTIVGFVGIEFVVVLTLTLSFLRAFPTFFDCLFSVMVQGLIATN
jgi:hypothetical protein